LIDLKNEIHSLKELLSTNSNNVFLKRNEARTKAILKRQTNLNKNRQRIENEDRKRREKAILNRQTKENENRKRQHQAKLDNITSNIDITLDSLLNPDDWKLITNSGQHNCGIFIKENNNKVIMKCENSKKSLVIYSDLLKKHIPFKFIPDIYRYNFKLDEKGKYNYYYEMERFNCDVTQLLFEILPKKNIEEYNHENSQNINIDKFYNLFKIIIKNSNPDQDIQSIIVYQNYYPWPEFSATADSKISAAKSIINIKERFCPLEFNFEIYKDLMSKYLSKLLSLLNAILSQIVILQNNLYEYNIRLSDLKFDNFGIIFKESNESYFGIELENNKFYDSYFFVYALDFESSVSIMQTDEEKTAEEKTAENKEYIKIIENISRWNFYGGYKLNKSINQINSKDILNSIISDKDKEDKDMDTLTNILSYELTLKL